MGPVSKTSCQLSGKAKGRRSKYFDHSSPVWRPLCCCSSCHIGASSLQFASNQPNRHQHLSGFGFRKFICSSATLDLASAVARQQDPTLDVVKNPKHVVQSLMERPIPVIDGTYHLRVLNSSDMSSRMLTLSQNGVTTQSLAKPNSALADFSVANRHAHPSRHWARGTLGCSRPFWAKVG